MTAVGTVIMCSLLQPRQMSRFRGWLSSKSWREEEEEAV